MPDLLFRFARREDARRLVDLIEAAYRGADASERWDSEAHLLRGPRTNRHEIQALLADLDSRFVVAETRGRIVGCALIQRHGAATLKTSDAAYFGMFAVDPAARLADVGKRLLAECERQARQLWAAPALVMTVINVRPQLIAWYERRGYRLTGARVPFPFNDTSGETTRDFDLLELRKDF